MSDERCEIKATCEERALPVVRSALHMHPAGIRKLYEPRIVQSVYFDTHEGAALAENIAGISEREKLRFRWYGTDGGRVRGQFECKRRVNNLGTKEVFVFDEELQVRGASRRAFLREVAAILDTKHGERGRIRAAELRRKEPVQWIRYRREYLGTADRVIRVTLDTELTTFDQRFGVRLSDRHATPTPRILVIECKADAESKNRIGAMLQDLPLVVDKCSKFTIASAPHHGPTPARLGW